MGEVYQVKVFGIEGEMKIIDLCDTEEKMMKMTVLQLRKKVAEKFPDSTGRVNTGAKCRVRLYLCSCVHAAEHNNRL